MLATSFYGSLDDAALHRVLADTKSDLMKKGDLREDCVWNVLMVIKENSFSLYNS